VYCVSAFAGGITFYRWWRMEEETRRLVWRLHGWFSGLMMFGSCIGPLTWAARMMSSVNAFQAADAILKNEFIPALSSRAIFLSWSAAFTVTYAIEFLCLSAARLMVLDRMLDFAAGKDEVARQRWAAGGRMVMAVVVLGNAVGLAAGIAAAVHLQRAAVASSSASAFVAANNLRDSFEALSTSRTEFTQALSIAAVSQFSEVAVLLLIIAAFIAAGFLCARRIRAIVGRSIRHGIDAAIATEDEGRRQMLKMAGSTVYVFLAFVVRSAFSTMFAVANQLEDDSHICPILRQPCDNSCKINSYSLMLEWIAFTPEFHLTIVLISSPLALLVALWGVTSNLTLRDQEMATTGRDLLSRAVVR
jgi:hypothetical protein